MKNLSILALLVLVFSSVSYGQIAHDLEIFSETGDKFIVVINGQPLSDRYGTHVKLDNIQNDNLHVKIEFEDKTKEPILKKYLLLADPGEQHDGPKAPQSNVYKVKANRKGKLRLAYVSRSPKKVQQVVHTQTVIHNTQTTSNSGASVTIQTPVGGISLTIFD